MRVEAGDTFLRVGAKDAQSNEPLWRDFPPKNGIVRNDKRDELR